MLRLLARRWFIDAMSYMALGLFCSLITGLILTQLSAIPFLAFLGNYAALVSASSPVVGAAIGAAIAYGLKGKPLVIFSGAVSGAIGYSYGGPVGAYLSALLGSEAAALVAGRTPFDIVLVPAANIIVGGIVGAYAGPGIQAFMDLIGGFVNRATELRPLPMGALVSAVMGLALTAPISSAAISISLGLDGLAAGAACAGCCAQMVGFAVQSYPDNGAQGLLSQGLGTSMLQFGNIMRKPVIWLPPTLASLVTGPLSAAVYGMRNNPLGAGMGTSGLVGQFGAWASMKDTFGPWGTLAMIVLLHFAAPAVLTWLIAAAFRKMGWIVPGDMKLSLR